METKGSKRRLIRRPCDFQEQYSAGRRRLEALESKNASNVDGAIGQSDRSNELTSGSHIDAAAGNGDDYVTLDRLPDLDEGNYELSSNAGQKSEYQWSDDEEVCWVCTSNNEWRQMLYCEGCQQYAHILY